MLTGATVGQPASDCVVSTGISGTVVTDGRHPSYDPEIHRLDTVLYVSTTRVSYTDTD